MAPAGLCRAPLRFGAAHLASFLSQPLPSLAQVRVTKPVYACVSQRRTMYTVSPFVSPFNSYKIQLA